MMFQAGDGTKALIFDIDGTLLDTMSVHFRAWQETFLSYGFELDRARFDKWGGLTSPEIVAHAAHASGLRLDSDAVCLAKDQAFIRHLPLVQPNAVVREVVEYHAGRLPIGLATNEHFGVANIIMRSTGLAHLFQTMVTADEVDRPKPAPDIFLECARRLGVEPAGCHVFEDTTYGVEAARAAGMAVTNVRSHL